MGSHGMPMYPIWDPMGSDINVRVSRGARDPPRSTRENDENDNDDYDVLLWRIPSRPAWRMCWAGDTPASVNSNNIEDRGVGGDRDVGA